MSEPSRTILFPVSGESGLSSIRSILDDFKAGKMVILVDDEGRENEGDLIIAAERVSPEAINFMASHGRGLICLSLSEDRCAQLNLAAMVEDNKSPYSTAFTVSIEAATGVTTGISASDRAQTIRTAVAKGAKPSDIVMPGHIFPIKAEPGGVLTRAGHTEAGSDLAKLCGFEPASVICEILNEDGTMARLPDLVEFSKQHGIKIGTIADLIRYRFSTESTVYRASETQINTEYGQVRAIVYKDDTRNDTHLALVAGEISADMPTLLRVHVFTGLYEVIGSVSSGHPWSIRSALKRVTAEGSGAVVILSYQQGSRDLADLVEENDDDEPEATGGHDWRVVGIGSQIAADIGFGKLKVLGSPLKMHGLSGFGLEIVEYVSQP